MEFLTGLQLLKTASDLITRIREVLGAREIKLDEVVARIIEIQGLISDSRTSFIDAQEQLLEKNRTISTLEKDNLKLRQQLSKKQLGRIHDGAVWKVLDDGKEEGPYCPNCHETTGNFIQPQRAALNKGSVCFFCTEHTKTFVFRVPVSVCGELPSDRPAPRPLPVIASFLRER